MEKNQTVFLHVIYYGNGLNAIITCYNILIFLYNSMQLKSRLLGLVSENYYQTGRCNVAFAKEPFGILKIGLAMSKNYSQYETYQRGYVIIIYYGLSKIKL